MTNDERRRVAAALRKVSVYTLAGRHEDGSVASWQVALVSDLAKAAGIEDNIGTDTFARLADLIDPDTTSDTTKSAEDTTKSGPDTTKAPTSSDATATHTDATATCDVSQSRRDTVACDPTERGIDSIYDWCRDRLEGADGDEGELCCAIMFAIEDYRHPELVTAHTVRAVDREACGVVA